MLAVRNPQGLIVPGLPDSGGFQWRRAVSGGLEMLSSSC
jgi:hypothetical protein